MARTLVRKWLWPALFAFMGALPAAGEENAAPAEEASAEKVPKETHRDTAGRVAPEQAARMAEMLRNRAGELRNQGDEQRARLLEERASAIEEGRISPRMMQHSRDSDRRGMMHRGMRHGTGRRMGRPAVQRDTGKTAVEEPGEQVGEEQAVDAEVSPESAGDEKQADLPEQSREQVREQMRDRMQEQRLRVARERQAVVDKIQSQAQEIKVLKERLEKAEDELAAIKALLKRLASE